MLSLIFIGMISTSYSTNSIILDIGPNGSASENEEYKQCIDDTKKGATAIFHKHVWPRIQKAGASYEITNCLEKQAVNSTEQPEYEIIAQIGSNTCTFKLQYDHFNSLDKKVILNDIEDQLKVCTEQLKKIENNKPNDDGHNEHELPSTSEFIPIDDDSVNNNHIKEASNELEGESYLKPTINLDKPNSLMVDESKENTNSLPNLPVIKNNKESLHGENVPKVLNHLAFRHPILIVGGWHDCTDQDALKVPTIINYLLLSDQVIPFAFYLENVLKCQFNNITGTKYRITLSIDRIECPFNVAQNTEGIHLMNAQELQESQCTKYLTKNSVSKSLIQ